MQNNVKTFYHLGLPKTASTYLQRSVFPFLKEIKYYKKHHYHFRDKDFETINDKVLFTCEMDETLFEELELIKKMHPNSRIIIVFREHYDWIKSKYKYYIRKNGHLKFNEFYKQILSPKLNLTPNYYSNIINKLKSDFPNKYLILSHSMLKENPNLFLKNLHDFLEIPIKYNYSNKKVKTAFSNKQLVVLRRYNNIFKYNGNRFQSKKAKKYHEKFRGALLFGLAFFANLNPWQGNSIEKEISAQKDEIKTYFKNDWNAVIEESK